MLSAFVICRGGLLRSSSLNARYASSPAAFWQGFAALNQIASNGSLSLCEYEARPRLEVSVKELVGSFLDMASARPSFVLGSLVRPYGGNSLSLGSGGL